MASSAKKRREEREQNLVQSTVTAVLKALKEQGIVPEKADNQNNEKQTSKKAAQKQTQKPSNKHAHPPVSEVVSNETIDYADDNNTHDTQPNNHIDIEIDSDTLDIQRVKNTQEVTVQTINNVNANSSSQGKQTGEGDIREDITALLTGGGNIHLPSPESFPIGPTPEAQSHSNPRTSVGNLTAQAKSILSHAISERTKKLYLLYWKRYVSFCEDNNTLHHLPVSVSNLLNFLASLIYKGYKNNTVAAHSSALAYINKAFGYDDFSGSFLVKQFFKGAKDFRDSEIGDSRLPITYEILRQLVTALPKVIPNLYARVAFATMCILAFHGFLRIGEICVKPGKIEDSVLQFSDVKLVDIDGITVGVELRLRKFKHSKQAVTLFLPVYKRKSCVCPVAATQLYLSVAKHVTGPFFQLESGTAITYRFFNDYLKAAIGFIGLETSKYKAHSFRIGAATHCAIQGFHEDAIKRMGRWKSSALQNYVRLPTLSL
ncbi:uncharacterized protein LOC128549722 isoform X2 [Mercenaria mercenaria]|nr:uncharacterized protein LOC123551831 isoform X2 [Mercenaria mercenaria]XP_045196976.2 uncharacterized protein LOC123551831 isoform X2 [Mercenaria mercenaria]XP_053383104.1 uncharacterized protein LOC128549722 isoform X2 [Mercenaria mercenaria]XP_053383105.1 uncharacterized protein LOC128549722 isoform X2 [Mercenaria mercenaria]